MHICSSTDLFQLLESVRTECDKAVIVYVKYFVCVCNLTDMYQLIPSFGTEFDKATF
jgi:hypothetical protein